MFLTMPKYANMPLHELAKRLTRVVQIYVMKGTNEVFTDYEKYLKRYVHMHTASDDARTYG